MNFCHLLSPFLDPFLDPFFDPPFLDCALDFPIIVLDLLSFKGHTKKKKFHFFIFG